MEGECEGECEGEKETELKQNNSVGHGSGKEESVNNIEVQIHSRKNLQESTKV